MRTIKFKYGYTDGGNWIFKFFTVEEVENGEPYEVLSDQPLLKNYRLKTRDQFTGWFDIKEKEIYEGDICRLWNGNKGYISYSDGFWCIGKKRRIINRYEHLEVIGNIHENPELLNLPDKDGVKKP